MYSYRVCSLFVNTGLSKLNLGRLPTHLCSERAASRKNCRHSVPSCRVCLSWRARAGRLVADRPDVWARRAPTAQETLHSHKKRRRRSLVLRKALRLSLADRPLLDCTSRNGNSPVVWLQCCSGPCCSAHASVPLQGVAPADATSRQKSSASPSKRYLSNPSHLAERTLSFWTA